MSLRARLLPLAARLRARVGLSGFDLRPVHVAVVTRTWTGGRRGAAAPGPGVPRYVDAVLDLPPCVVRQLTTREIASSGRLYEQGDMLVGPLTPAFTRADGSRGGVSEQDLKPTPAGNGVETFYVLSGAHAGEYQLRELRSTRPLRYEVVLARRRTTP